METAQKKKRPRAKRGEVINWREPVWEPLLELARIYIDEFGWGAEIELKNGTRIQEYQHIWTRRVFYLGSDGRAYAYAGDEKFREIPEEEFLEHFDRVVGRWDPCRGIPGYTRLNAESDGFDAC